MNLQKGICASESTRFFLDTRRSVLVCPFSQVEYYSSDNILIVVVGCEGRELVVQLLYFTYVIVTSTKESTCRLSTHVAFGVYVVPLLCL